MPRLPLFAALLVAASCAGASGVSAQTGAVTDLPVGARNGVTTLAEADGRLYAGPRLVIVEPDGRVRFAGTLPALDPATSNEARAFSIAAVPGGRAVVGLGFTNDLNPDEPIPTAAGFAITMDGGETFTYRAPPLDASSTTTVQYGVSTLQSSPVFTPDDAPPYDVAIDPASGAIYSANALAGLRVSTDDGATWRRVVLPPDTLFSITPEAPYNFPYTPAGVLLPGATEPGDVSLYGFNFVAYSVIVDEEGTVWAGTLAGLNRSDAEDIDEASGDRAWTRYEADFSRPSPAGSFIISLEAREIDDARDEVWMAAWPSGRSEQLAPNAVDERFGVTVWRGDNEDGSPRFETVLLGERIYALAFRDETAYAAGQNGLFISDDAGRQWRAVRIFRDASGQVLPLRPGTGVFAVSVTDDGTLWVGTGDGLLKSTDGGASFELSQSAVPTRPGALDRSDEIPEVEAYAFPNPFSPRNDRAIQVVFPLDAPGSVRVRVFDFGMRLIRDIQTDATPNSNGDGVVRWEGTADDGTRIANGTYIYVVDAGGSQASGKILILD